MDERFASVNGIDLCYQTLGDPGDEPLLLVMGLGAQMIAWPLELCEGLVDRGFHVIRYDNRDTGRSTWLDASAGDFMTAFTAALAGEPVTAPYTLSDMAADGIALLGHLDIDAAHVVGASMGGMIAQAMAIEHPHRLRSLTSVMSTTGDLDVGLPTPEALAILTQPAPDERAAAIESSVASSKVISSPDHFDEDLARARATAAYDRGWHPAGTARHLLAILASGSRSEALASLPVPTLVIHGDQDPLVTPSGGQRTAEVIPGAELLVLEGMGHDLPAAYLGPIIDAITAHAARTASL
jgi:pimeloyl-ACP methyl ester carboxylesterase